MRAPAEARQSLAEAIETALAEAQAAEGPLVRYQRDPVAYVAERLGVELLPHQQAIAYAVAGRWERITDEMRELAELTNEGQRKIAVTSGQKTGKSLLIVCLSLWFYDCFPEARAMLTAAKGDQIRTVLWRELGRVMLRAKTRPIGTCSTDPSRGMLSPDRTREIRGFTGRSVESLAGVSGNLVYFVDEASHLEQSKAEAVEGNTAGEGSLGGPIVYTSNPTQTSGPFFEAFHSKSEYWTTAHFDAEKIARWQADHRKRVPGMATLERIASWAEEYGPTSPFYLVRVKGEFLRNETGRIISLHLIEAARERWATAPEEGSLVIGYDPAGPGKFGDEHGFAAVRGLKCVHLSATAGLTEDAAIEHLSALVRVLRKPNETPRIMIDAEGEIGSTLYGRLVAESEERRVRSPMTAFDVYAVRVSSRHVRDPRRFERVRDEIWWVLAQWMTEGAIPLDHKLEAELHEPVWIPMPDERIRATPKVDIRDALGRSPDRADALALAVFPPRVLRAELGDPGAQPAAPRDLFEAASAFDQQSGADIWWPTGG